MTDVGRPTVAVWVCPQPGCDYQINRPDAGRDAEGFDRRAIAAMSTRHAAERHGQPVSPRPGLAR